MATTLSDNGSLEAPPVDVWRRAVRHLAPFLLKRRAMIIVAGVALISGSAIELLKPWPMKLVVDYVIEGVTFLPAWAQPESIDPTTWMLMVVCAFILVVALLSSAAAYLQEFLLQRLGEEMSFELRMTLFSHVQCLGLGFHHSSRLGDIITRITDDTRAVRDLATTSLLQVSMAVLTLLAMLTIMLVMDWQLALVALATLPILGPSVWHFRRAIEHASRQRRKRESELSSVTQETMSSIRLVKTLGREEHQKAEFGRESSKSAEIGLRVARLEAAYARTVDVIAAAGTCAVIWFGVQRVLAGSLQAGDLIVFAAYVHRMHSPLRDLAKQSAKVAKGKAGMERVLDVLELAPAVSDAPDARPAPGLTGRITFEHVSFEYQPGMGTLKDIHFQAEPGEVIALVGHSGAGKSTILSLLSRLYDPSSGRILVDGHDLRELTLDSLHEQISVVLQESVLLQTSIAENIRYGRHDASPDDVLEAAQAAGVEQFIGRLSEGYETIVGPRGETISGGERQRVAIARAVIRNAPILLLDEPTTGLDVHSEELVMAALARLMEGRTTLIVSHKLSLIQRADRILVVDAGRIIESGTDRELQLANGVYARLRATAYGDGEVDAGADGRPMEDTTRITRS